MKKVISGFLAMSAVIFLIGCPAPSKPHLRAVLHTEDSHGNSTVTDLPQISEVDAPDGALVTYENGGGFGSAEATIYLDNVPNPIVQPVTRATKEAEIGDQKSSEIIIAAALIGIYASTCVVNEGTNSFDIAVPCGDNLVTLVLKVVGEDGSYCITTFRGRAYNEPQPTVGYHLSTMVSPVGSGGISVDPNLTSYDAGTVVNLAASANAGWVFDHWTVNSVESANHNADAQVKMDSDVQVIAVFASSAPSDTTPPIITLNGSATVNLTIGVTWSDPGATAYDAIDGNVPVSITGSANTSVAGNYTLTYTASDKSHNTATKTRTVFVSAPPTDTTGKVIIDLTTAAGIVSFKATAPDGYAPATFGGIGDQSQISSLGLQLYYTSAVSGLWTDRQTFSFNGWPCTGVFTKISGKTLRFEVVANSNQSAGWGDPNKLIVRLDGVIVTRLTNEANQTAYQVKLP